MQMGHVALWGPFRVRDNYGIDCTPRGMKERAAVALLVLSPGQHRRRLWLQDMLWGHSVLEAGQTSLRRALANIRRDFGPLSGILKSDRNAVWLEPELSIRPNEGFAPADFLSDVDVPNEEFESWLRDQRQAQPEPQASPPNSPPPSQDSAVPTINIVSIEAPSEDSRFFNHMLAQLLAVNMASFGECRTLFSARMENAKANYTFSIEVHSDDKEWHILLRLLGDPIEQHLWSGRERLPRCISQIWDCPELTRIFNKAHVALGDQFVMRGPNGDVARIQRAVQRIYNFDRPGLATAIDLLRASSRGNNAGLALAWLAFAQLTSVLEFRDRGAAKIEEAVALANDAVLLSPRNPTILGLAAQVQLNLTGDFDYGHYLALHAVEEEETNPYALDALSQSQMLRGELARSHRTAQYARDASAGLTNSFCWDMQAAFGALCQDRVLEAEELARICHRKMPEYRPAIRYLVALNMLLGEEREAQKFATRLARIEPGFTIQQLIDESYPIETLRKLGFAAELRSKIF